MNRILVVGANGQLGNELRLIKSDYEVYYSDLHKDDKTEAIDITNIDCIRDFVKANGINVIINCAAYTNVDKAEDDRDVADLINNKAVENLAVVAKEYNAFLVHVSTDYVFDGSNCVPYLETDATNPIGVYGVTKLAGEESIKSVLGELGNFVIIRTAWLYSAFGNNFVKTMRKLTSERESLNVVFDQVGSPTYAGDLANVIIKSFTK
jgi:dTDP-4-dehydrorhamnose reductase